MTFSAMKCNLKLTIDIANILMIILSAWKPNSSLLYGDDDDDEVMVFH